MISPNIIVFLKPNSPVYLDTHLSHQDYIAAKFGTGASEPLQDVDSDLPMSEEHYTYHTTHNTVYVRVEDVLSSATLSELREEHR